MNINQYKTFIKPIQPESFNEFISLVMQSFTKELNLISKSFYNYETSPDGVKGYDNVFKIIERTWVGIFQSALIKSDSNIVCMQEFNVLNGERVFGRCDFLFDWNNGESNQIITEAKCYEFINDWQRSLNQTFFNRLLNQAYGYYDNEKEYYKQNTWLLALVFEWVRDSSKLDNAKSIMDTWNCANETPDFISLITGEQRGVFIYGQIRKAEDFTMDKGK